MNYYDDPHDMKVMGAVMRRALDIVAHWPGNRKIGPCAHPALPRQEARRISQMPCPSDALLEDLRFALFCTVYHQTSTCRIGERRRSKASGVGVEEPTRGRRERHAQRN